MEEEIQRLRREIEALRREFVTYRADQERRMLEMDYLISVLRKEVNV